MTKLIRLTKEAFFMLSFLINPMTYYRERLHGFSDRELTIRLRNGIVYTIQSNTCDVNIIDELWHRRIYDKLISYIKPGATVIDIGAQVGIFTVKAATHTSDVRVFSFEPVKKNFELLQKNIRNNHLEQNVHPFNCAVAGEPGELVLYVHDKDTGGGSIHPHGNEATMKTVRVPATTLAQIFKDNHIDVCDFAKIDCEGAELPILLKSPPELLQKIRSMSIEWHDDLNVATMPLPDFENFLKGVGFSVSFDGHTGTLYAWRSK